MRKDHTKIIKDIADIGAAREEAKNSTAESPVSRADKLELNGDDCEPSNISISSQLYQAPGSQDIGNPAPLVQVIEVGSGSVTCAVDSEPDEEEPLLSHGKKSSRKACINKQELSLKSQWLLNHFTHTVATDLFFTDRIAANLGGNSKVNYLRHLLGGARFVTNKLWPAAFSGLILHDFIVFGVKGLSDYGVTIPQILLGTADSQQILTTYLGSDLARERLYWVGASVVFGTALVAGVTQVCYKHKKNQIQYEMPVILEDPRGVNEYFQQYWAWSHGKSIPLNSGKNVGFFAAFWMLTGYLLYAEARLYKIWIEKLMGESNYRQAERDCNARNMTYTYIDEYQNYECIVCDWDFVDYWKRASTQACLDGLLSAPLSPEEVLAGMDVIARHSDFERIDATKIDFRTWTGPQFQNFTDKIIASGVPQLDAFNMSAPEKNPSFPNDGRVENLKEVFTKIPTQKIILRNQGIGAEKIEVLAPAFNRSTMVDVGGNRLGDEGNRIIVLNLGNKTDTYISNDNNISDDGMVELMSLMPPSVKSGDFSKNNFGDRGLQAVGEWVAKGNVEEIILSKNPGLATADYDQFGQKIEGSALKRFIVEESGMDDFAVEALTPHFRQMQLEKFLVSDNPITNDGFYSTMQDCVNTTVVELGFRGTKINGEGLTAAAPLLQQLRLLGIDLSKIPANLEGFLVFTKNFPGINLESFIASDNPYLGDNFLRERFIELSGLRNIVLDRIRATDAGAVPLMTAAGSGNVVSVSLAENQNITDITLITCASANVTNFNLSGNNLGGQGGVVAVGKVTHLSNLKNFDIGNNPKITSEEMYELSRNLVTGIPSNDLAEFNRDQIRWLQKHGKPKTNMRFIIADGNPQDIKEIDSISLIQPTTNLTFSNKNSTSTRVAAALLSFGVFSSGSAARATEVGPFIAHASFDIKVALGIGSFAALMLLILVYKINQAVTTKSSILPTYHRFGGGHA